MPYSHMAEVRPGAQLHGAGGRVASGQGYTPFEGQELTGRVTATFLRGALVYEGARVVGAARGRYVARPESAPGAAS